MIRRVSEKRLKANGGKMYSSISKKPTRIRKRPRSKSEFARIYHSKARVEFVKSLPCAACGVVGYSQNAHVAGESGVGYKADAEFIAPLCGPHGIWANMDDWYIGCHTMYDEHRESFNRRFPDFDPEKAAQETETAWRKHEAE